ncbi:MAG TPA: hypothetical protein VIN75_00650, partial [Burkholderiaceae bacterium]
MNESAAAWAYTGLSRTLRDAALTVLAMAGAVAGSQAVAHGPAAGVLGAVLALSLSRSHLVAGRHGWLEAAVLLPVVSLASHGVGALLLHVPWLGAAAFVVAGSVPAWARRLGTTGRRLGRLLTLPLVTILVVPGLPLRPAWGLPPAFAAVAPAVIALIALACVMLVQGLGKA